MRSSSFDSASLFGSASSFIVRNLKQVNSLLFLPTRVCKYKAGPVESFFIKTNNKSQIGKKSKVAKQASTKSMILLQIRLTKVCT